MKTIILLALSVFPSYLANAKSFPGYYIDYNGEKIETTFKVREGFDNGEPKYHNILHSIKYIDNGKVFKLTPSMCKKIGFYIDTTIVEFLSLPNKYLSGIGYDMDSIFLRPKIIGPATLYYYYYYSTTTGMGANGGMYSSSSPEVGWIIEKDNGQILKITYGGGKRKDLAEFFNDFTALAQKIEDKETKKSIIRNTEKLVEVYNLWRERQ